MLLQMKGCGVNELIGALIVHVQWDVHSGLGLCICEGKGGRRRRVTVLLQWDRHRWFKPKGTRQVNTTR